MEDIKLYNTEEFQLEKKQEGKKQKVILKGNAMPLNETSRNGVFYRPKSVKKAYKSLENAPFLFAHQQEEVRHILGKVEKVGITDEAITYEADIDPEEKEFIRKSEKGYIKNVSVGVMVDPETVDIDEEKGIAKVDVLEFVELSSAPVPGFKNTSGLMSNQVIQIAEKLGDKKAVEKLKKNKEANDDDDDDDDDDEEEEDGEKELKARVEELFGKIEELENVVSALQSKVDTLLEEEEEKDDDKDDDDDDDEEEDDDDKDNDDDDDDDDDKEKDNDDDDDDDDDDDEEETKDDDKDDDKEKDPNIPEPDKGEKFKGKHIPKQGKEQLKRKEKELKTNKKDTLSVNLEKQIKKNKKY